MINDKITDIQRLIQLKPIVDNFVCDNVPVVSEIKKGILIKKYKEIDKLQLILTITFLIKNFCDMFNVVRNMNDTQIYECANILIDECPCYTFEDFICMFTIAKKNKLVKIYDRIDLQIILEILEKYEVIRGQENLKLIELEKQQEIENNRLIEIEREKSGEIADFGTLINEALSKVFKPSKNAKEHDREYEVKMKSLLKVQSEIKNSDTPDLQKLNFIQSEIDKLLKN